MRKRSYLSVGIILALILFVAINGFAFRAFSGVRLDLTQGHLYTLSPGTRAVLKQIDEPITLRFYFSKRLGQEIGTYGLYAQRVRDMLQEYAATARGKIDLRFLEPTPFSVTEDQATLAGLQGVPLDQGGEQVYFGLVGTNSTDDTQKIAFFQPERERFLEYDLSRMIQSLARPKKHVVGLMTQLPLEGDMMAAMQGRPTRAYAVIDQLRQTYDIRTVSTAADKIEPDIDLLMIVQPQGLTDATLYAVDQYVMKGGRIMVFTDPYSEVEGAQSNPMMGGGGPTDSNLERIYKSWGIEMAPGKVAADKDRARRVNMDAGGGRPQAVDYVAWLGLKGEDLDQSDPVTADFTQINVATAGILRPLPGAKTVLTPLVSTSPDSEELDVAKVTGMPDVTALLSSFKRTDKRLVIAARVSGDVTSAFPDGPPKPPPPAPAAAGAQPAQPPAPPVPAQSAADFTAKSVRPLQAIVVADTDLLADRFWVQAQDFFGQRVVVPTANNGDFINNAVDSLAGSADLIGLRSRAVVARPFTLVGNLQRDAESRFQSKEKALEDQLKATQQKIAELRGPAQPNTSASPASLAQQQQAIDAFRNEIVDTRTQLRQVQLALRENIDRLRSWLVFANVALVPLLVALAAIVLGLFRLRRRNRRFAAAGGTHS